MSGDVRGVDLENVSVTSGPSTVNVYNEQQSRLTLEERVMDLERMVYGERRWSEPGLIKRQQRQLYISVTNMILTLLTFVLLLLSLWR